jgi:hypothetical protein
VSVAVAIASGHSNPIVAENRHAGTDRWDIPHVNVRPSLQRLTENVLCRMLHGRRAPGTDLAASPSSSRFGCLKLEVH